MKPVDIITSLPPAQKLDFSASKCIGVMFLYLQDWCNINVVIKTIANDDTCTRHVKSVLCCTCNNNYAESEIDIVRRFIFKVK